MCLIKKVDMKRLKVVTKDVITMYLAFFGLVLIGLIAGVTTALIFWGIPRLKLRF